MATRRFNICLGILSGLLLWLAAVVSGLAQAVPANDARSDGAMLQCLPSGSSAVRPWSDPMDGAADPSLPGNAGPAVVPPYETVSLDNVSPNVRINDRLLCPNGRGLQQNETSIVVSGQVIIAAFNDARGGQGSCPAEH